MVHNMDPFNNYVWHIKNLQTNLIDFVVCFTICKFNKIWINFCDGLDSKENNEFLILNNQEIYTSFARGPFAFV